MAFRRAAKLLGVTVSLVLVVAVLAFPSSGSSLARRSSERELTNDEEGKFEALEAADQYADARTSPADTVDAGAFSAAYAAAKALPVVGGPWSEITTAPYQNDDHAYRDPVWSNSGAGWGLVTGRATALAADGTSTIYVGMADGGVWKTTNGGTSWAPLLDDAPTLSIGAVAVNPSDHSVWAGTGEANTSSDSYSGIGVLRSTDGGANWSRVGGDELQNHLISRLVFDGQGSVYAATSVGLYKHSASSAAGAWTLLLKPCVGQHDTTFISDVVVRPGTDGQTVVAVVGWRAGSACNGFYVSHDAGASFAPIALTGSINEHQIGRTMLAYSSDGGTLYALVQSSALFNHGTAHQAGTLLMGVFVSPKGEPAGPWSKIAESSTLAASGSALKGFRGYYPGVQAWYNEFLTVDPSDADHVYLGLEEVFETTNGGQSWKAIGPYWNFGLKCAAGGLDNCPTTTHPDQHAVQVVGNRVYVGNDGGVWSRPLRNASGWTDHNLTLRSLQYYFAAVGSAPGGDAYWGGLQDNGESLLLPDASTMVSPFGGDGGDTLVDPDDADRAVVEYVGLDMALTTNGGRSDGTTPSWIEISPSCSAFTYTPSPCDPLPRFIAPFESDPQDLDHWVAGGEFVWDNGGKGWDTRCSSSACDWTIVHDTGAGHSITAIAVNGDVTYAGWCGPCNAPTFASGIDTNYGGTWHTVSAPNLPNRFVSAITVDPADAAHVFAVYNGFSRRWVTNGGIGHVFESTDGGATWTDVSGNLPDAPSDDLLLVNGHLVLATDLGVFVADAGDGAATTWSRFGSGLPNASTNDLALSPEGSYIVAGTHGRGLWRIASPT
jgi:photosystem II stability/assembly factor-like uncharacterized protein